MPSRSLNPTRMFLAATLVCLATVPAGAQNRASSPSPHALRGVRLTAEEGAARKTLILRDGRIEAILPADAEVPGDTRVIEVDGLIAVPGFIDAWTTTGCETPPPTAEKDRPASVRANVRVDMRQANRKGIQPAFHAATVYALDAEGVEKHRAAGFGVLVSAPSGEILSGQSVLAVTRDAAPRDVVLKDGVFPNAAFRASGSGYPNTLMGFHAQLRQFFYDADHYRALGARRDAGKPGPRPAWDPDLAEGVRLLEGEQTLVCSADSARDIQRWLKLADEFGLKVAIAGGEHAWKVADELAARDVTVFLDLDWGDEVEDPDAPEDEAEEEIEEVAEEEGEPNAEDAAGDAAEDEAEEKADEGPEQDPAQAEAPEEEEGLNYDYSEPEGIRREKRRLWVERRDNALRLREAGVRVVFGTGGRKPSELLKSVRTLVEEGYPREAALASLTGLPAEVLDVDGEFGWLLQGRSATLSLWNADPFDEDAQVVWSFVEGYPEEFDVKEDSGEGPAEGADLSGRWELSVIGEENSTAIMTLKMDEEGRVTGKAQVTRESGGEQYTASVKGKLSGNDVSLTLTIAMGEMKIKLEFDGELKGDTMKGDGSLSLPGLEADLTFKAKRMPDSVKGGN